jgi:hypothetical protein
VYNDRRSTIAGRREAGLPEDWAVVEGWATAEPPFFTKFKAENINKNQNKVTGKTLPEKFWRDFPHRKLPQKPTTKVKVAALEKLIKKHKKSGLEKRKRRRKWR